jgi:LemA protein
MKKGTIAIVVVVAILLILVFSVVGKYNQLVTLNENVEASLSQIDNQLQRRNDLIPNLVETVKGYASHEEEIFTSIADARARLIGGGSMEDMAQASDELSGSLSRLLAISESYPELKANENFINLSTELAGTENRIAVARRDYNNTAREYNTLIRRFPTVIIANMFGFERYDYFEASQGAAEVPGVQF